MAGGKVPPLGNSIQFVAMVYGHQFFECVLESRLQRQVRRKRAHHTGGIRKNQIGCSR